MRSLVQGPERAVWPARGLELGASDKNAASWFVLGNAGPPVNVVGAPPSPLGPCPGSALSQTQRQPPGPGTCGPRDGFAQVEFSSVPWGPSRSFLDPLSSLCLSLLPDEFKCPIKEEVALTSGEWEVLARHGSKVPGSPCTLVHTQTCTHTCAPHPPPPDPSSLCPLSSLPSTPPSCSAPSGSPGLWSPPAGDSLGPGRRDCCERPLLDPGGRGLAHAQCHLG